MWENEDRSRDGVRPQNCAANQNAGKCWQAPIKLEMGEDWTRTHLGTNRPRWPNTTFSLLRV